MYEPTTSLLVREGIRRAHEARGAALRSAIRWMMGRG